MGAELPEAAKAVTEKKEEVLVGVKLGTDGGIRVDKYKKTTDDSLGRSLLYLAAELRAYAVKLAPETAQESKILKPGDSKYENTRKLTGGG